MRRVRQHGDFVADYRAQLAWLDEHADPAWIEGLLEGTDRIMRTLSMFPSAGTRQDQRGGAVLRKLGYPRLPYVVWYAYAPDQPAGDLWLVRLFHGRQEHPQPDVRPWLPLVR